MLSRFRFQPNMTKQRMADFHRVWIEGATRPLDEVAEDDLIIELEKIGDLPPYARVLRPNATGELLLSLLAPALDKMHEYRCRGEVNVIAARVLLALSRYRDEHGQLPQS